MGGADRWRLHHRHVASRIHADPRSLGLMQPSPLFVLTAALFHTTSPIQPEHSTYDMTCDTESQTTFIIIPHMNEETAVV